MKRTLAILTVLLVTSCLAYSAAEASTATTIGSLSRPSSLSAYRNKVVWDEYDSSAKTFYLNVKDGRQVGRLPVEPAKEGFEASLGPGPDGSVWAVYRRCKRKTCRFYRYSFSDKTEKRLRANGFRVWGRNLLAVSNGGNFKIVDALTGKTKKFVVSLPFQRNGTFEIAFWTHYIAYITESGANSAVWLTDTNSGRTKRVLDRGAGESGFGFIDPSFDRGSLYVSGICVVDGGCNTVTAYSLRTHRYSRGSGGPSTVGSFARAGSVNYFVAVGLDDSNQTVCTPSESDNVQVKACEVVEVRGQTFKSLKSP